MHQSANDYHDAHPTVAVLEDHFLTADVYRDIFESEGFNAGIFDYNNDCHQFIRKQRPDLIVLDMVSEIDNGGLALLKNLLDDMGTTLPPLIVATALPSADIRRIQRDVLPHLKSRSIILPKPFDIRHFIDIIHDMVKRVSPTRL